MWKKGRGTTKWKLGDVETVVDAEHGPFDKLRAGSAEETHVACHGYCQPRMVFPRARDHRYRPWDYPYKLPVSLYSRATGSTTARAYNRKARLASGLAQAKIAGHEPLPSGPLLTPNHGRCEQHLAFNDRLFLLGSRLTISS